MKTNRLLFFCFLSAVFLIPTSLWAQREVPSEYQVKAAFLYHFAKFVEWPPTAFAQQPNDLLICVMGKDPFGASLEQAMAGKSVHGRKLSILRLEKEGKLKSCHILFISSSEKNRLEEIRETIQGTSILTVGETGQFAQMGFIINLSWTRTGCVLKLIQARQSGRG